MHRRAACSSLLALLCACEADTPGPEIEVPTAPDVHLSYGLAQVGAASRVPLSAYLGLSLLGEDQEAFLARWVEQWDQDVWMKVLLSQTPFACVQTLPEGSRGGVQPR